MDLLRKKVPTYLTIMVKQFLTVDLIKTIGDTEDWAELDGGVPQCSSLYPLLFIIYIDELANQL